MNSRRHKPCSEGDFKARPAQIHNHTAMVARLRIALSVDLEDDFQVENFAHLVPHET